jgi:hypothetical protein
MTTSNISLWWLAIGLLLVGLSVALLFVAGQNAALASGAFCAGGVLSMFSALLPPTPRRPPS